jgi:hypothetical protein
MWLREIVTKVLINPIIRTRTPPFSSRVTVLTALLSGVCWIIHSLCQNIPFHIGFELPRWGLRKMLFSGTWRLEEIYQCFGGTYWLHLWGRSVRQASSKQCKREVICGDPEKVWALSRTTSEANLSCCAALSACSLLLDGRLAYSSTLKMEAVHCSETSLIFYRVTGSCITNDYTLHIV